jgi:hypothetical protein
MTPRTNATWKWNAELSAVGRKVDANRLLVFVVELPNEQTSEHRLGYSTMYVVRWESALPC